jgi:hypothetical protein
LLRTKSLEPPIGEYRWVPGFSEIITAINCTWQETGKPVEVSLDTETMGLYPWYKDKQIVSIGFTLEAGRADCLYLGPYPDPVGTIEPELFEQIEWLLITPRIRLRGCEDRGSARDAVDRHIVALRSQVSGVSWKPHKLALVAFVASVAEHTGSSQRFSGIATEATKATEARPANCPRMRSDRAALVKGERTAEGRRSAPTRPSAAIGDRAGGGEGA